MANSKITIKNGAGVHFWKDVWVGDFSFQYSLPNLYKLSKNNNAFVRDMVSDTNAWNMQLSRNMTEIKLGDILRLIQLIGILNISDSKEGCKS